MAQASGISAPSFRRLRVYAFDPSLSIELENAGINDITIGVRWEDLRPPNDGNDCPGRPGIRGEYLEVVDFDPASGVFYAPLDLNEPHLLAQDGLSPSEGNPQFHQQMVYAVAMTTIGHFERALGRVALWAPHRPVENDGMLSRDHYFVRRLRLYPHALRQANAFYSPAKKAVLFGYFANTRKDERNTPGTLIFTCLSHDIIAHEVTHALLDGVHPRFAEPTNPDVLAFHEAFADLVALFQHFSYPGVLRDQIARTRGKLDSESFLGELAQQFGRAVGSGHALRGAIGVKEDGVWKAREPRADALDGVWEPHKRGEILVAAVFSAYMAGYRQATRDLYRIATQGSGVLPEGDIHPALVNQLAETAANCAEYVLRMCIKAIDYCPPVDMTFGDYLRAVITADVETNPRDPYGFQVAFIESFRKWGITPRGVKSLSVSSLLWDTGDQVLGDAFGPEAASKTKVLLNELFAEKDNKATFKTWDLDSDRFEVWKTAKVNSALIGRWLKVLDADGKKFADALRLVVDAEPGRRTVYCGEDGRPSVEVHSVRTALRRNAHGNPVTDLVIELTQRRRGYFDPDEQDRKDAADGVMSRDEDGDFKYRTGCTLLIDTVKREIRRVIRTAGSIADNDELDRTRDYLKGAASPPANAFSGDTPEKLDRNGKVKSRYEPFALLHSQSEG